MSEQSVMSPERAAEIRDRFENPPWDGFDFFEFEGKQVRFAYAPPKSGVKPVGTRVALGGFADFINSNAETASEEHDDGYAVWEMDHPGQGGSERYDAAYPKRPHPEAMEASKRALEYFVREVVKPLPGLSLSMRAHSKGGGVAWHAAHQKWFDYIISAAPMMRADITVEGIESQAKVLGQLVDSGFGPYTSAEVNRFFNGAAAEKPGKVVEHLKKDRYADGCPVRMGIHEEIAQAAREQGQDLRVGELTASAFLSFMPTVRNLATPGYAESIETPMLVICGTEDEFVHLEALRAFVERMPRGQFEAIEGGYHNLWTSRDSIRDVVMCRARVFSEEQNEAFLVGRVFETGSAAENVAKPEPLL